MSVVGRCGGCRIGECHVNNAKNRIAQLPRFVPLLGLDRHPVGSGEVGAHEPLRRASGVDVGFHYGFDRPVAGQVWTADQDMAVRAVERSGVSD